MKWFFLYVTLILVSLGNALGREKAPECEVCVELLTTFESSLTVADKKNLIDIESKLDDFCSTDNMKISGTFKKLCYFLKPIKREVSQPLSNGVPVDRICKRLKKKSAEICSIRPPVKVEKGNTDYSKMRVKQLKKVLADRGVSCTNCLEKSEFVKKCQDTEHLEL